MEGLIKFWVIVCTLIGSLLALILIGCLVSPDLAMRPLVRQDNPAKGADAIVMLMGDAADRVPHAAELLKEDYAPRIVFAETERTPLMKVGLHPREGEMVFGYFTKILKVPESEIRFLRDAKVSSTREEAEVLLKELKRLQVKRVVLVTSWYHSSRAAWIFEQLNKEGIQIQSFPTETPLRWYRDELGTINMWVEYLKWPYYRLKYSNFKFVL